MLLENLEKPVFLPICEATDPINRCPLGTTEVLLKEMNVPPSHWTCSLGAPSLRLRCPPTCQWRKGGPTYTWVFSEKYQDYECLGTTTAEKPHEGRALLDLGFCHGHVCSLPDPRSSVMEADSGSQSSAIGSSSGLWTCVWAPVPGLSLALPLPSPPTTPSSLLSPLGTSVSLSVKSRCWCRSPGPIVKVRWGHTPPSPVTVARMPCKPKPSLAGCSPPDTRRHQGHLFWPPLFPLQTSQGPGLWSGSQAEGEREDPGCRSPLPAGERSHGNHAGASPGL